MILDVCYGGCGGIWFDAAELERVSARAVSTMHTIWNVPVTNVKQTDLRICPRCERQILDQKWFSELQKVEIANAPGATASGSTLASSAASTRKIREPCP